jgi:demethylmenaquinone methyltransferase/2-methoxy-6-polyprenyl-1,4-benzoquinol methylase
MDDYYNQIAEGYEELHREEQEAKIDFIKSKLDDYFKIESSHKLLDVGCGTGITTIPWLCNRTGLDPASKLLEKGNKKNEVKYVLGRAEKLPFEDNTFDIVTSITAIQNFEDLEKGLSEIRRVGKQFFILTYLKKSGKAKQIEEIINKLFKVKKRYEEDKDIIFFASKKSIPPK